MHTSLLDFFLERSYWLSTSWGHSLEKKFIFVHWFQRMYIFKKESLIIYINYSIDIHLHFSSATHFHCQPLELAHFQRENSKVRMPDHKLQLLSLSPGLQTSRLGSSHLFTFFPPLSRLWWKKITGVLGFLVSAESHLENTGTSLLHFLYPS